MLAAECSVLCSMVSEPSAVLATCWNGKVSFALLLYNALAQLLVHNPNPLRTEAQLTFLHIAFAALLG